jgi:hypothetical protein
MNILVIGKAKTGTTVISKTIANALNGKVNYFMEPKEPQFFQTAPANDASHHNIAKIIFEHWTTKHTVLKQAMANQLPFRFDKTIFIVRDLRDEIISRILYYAYAIYQDKPDYLKVEQWIKILQQKENKPSALSCLDVVKKMGEIFALDGEEIVRGSIRQARLYSDFIQQQHLPEAGIVLKYEDFMSGELGTLEAYLDLPPSSFVSLSADANAPGKELNIVRRSATFNNWKSFFTSQDIVYLRPQIADVMETFGYADWQLQAVAQLNPDHYSGYIKRVFGMA